MGPANSLYAAMQYNKFNERFDLMPYARGQLTTASEPDPTRDFLNPARDLIDLSASFNFDETL